MAARREAGKEASCRADHLVAFFRLASRGRATKISASSDGSKLVYTNDKTVVLRDLRQLSASTTYTQHNSPATVARLSPSGYYVASADTSGTVRIWDVAGTDQVLKLEMKGCLGGKVNDLAWDAESKRVIAVGEGRERSVELVSYPI